MANTARENILVYIASQLTTTTGATVYRSRQAAVERSEGTVIVIKPTEEVVEKLSDYVSIRRLSLVVTVLIRGLVPDTAADPFLQQIQTVMLSSDTLGGLAARCIEKTTRWDMEMADLTALAVEVVYEVVYTTPANSIAALA